MSFRLIRGCAADLIFEHYRKRTKEEGPFPDLAGRFDCLVIADDSGDGYVYIDYDAIESIAIRGGVRQL